ncbi:unnamed protein product [Ceratitis capitata]|uniref:(Mediterranean fruit fly) hypothetical protein n=1 Tax=Ceratitis capitata TaxID=7213 RepID=A0A811USC8_CERCA|nr:unnamed protein product [Ceratitis capitata]
MRSATCSKYQIRRLLTHNCLEESHSQCPKSAQLITVLITFFMSAHERSITALKAYKAHAHCNQLFDREPYTRPHLLQTPTVEVSFDGTRSSNARITSASATHNYQLAQRPADRRITVRYSSFSQK